MLYECRTDCLRQTEAMRVLSAHFKRGFKESKNRTDPFDFATVTKGCVCEHKYRHYNIEDFKKFPGGGIWFETSKYNALMALSKKRGDVPLFVVTLKSGYVLYADIRKIDTSAETEAFRPVPRDDHDIDPCYLVPLSLFKGAGKARTFVRKER
jgi:hypothetical protein